MSLLTGVHCTLGQRRHERPEFCWAAFVGKALPQGDVSKINGNRGLGTGVWLVRVGGGRLGVCGGVCGLVVGRRQLALG